MVIDKLASILSPIASYQEACRIKRTDEFMEKLRREYYPKEGQKDHRRRGKRRIGSNGGKSEEGQNKRQQADSGGEGGIVFSKNTAQKSIKPPQHKSPDGKEIAALKETAGELKSCISIGVNSITRGMEAMIVNQRQQLQQQLKETEKQQIVGNYRIVFVCLKDVSNPYFFSHIPSLCGISSSSSMVTYLVPLLKVGSQKILSQALGLKSVSCVAIKV